MDAGATGVAVYVGGNSTWPLADGAVDIWGAAVYSQEFGARLHKVLTTRASDANGKATLDIFPRLREAHPDFSAIITSSPKGTFRLAENRVAWDIDEVKTYGLGFKAVEAF